MAAPAGPVRRRDDRPGDRGQGRPVDERHRHAADTAGPGGPEDPRPAGTAPGRQDGPDRLRRQQPPRHAADLGRGDHRHVRERPVRRHHAGAGRRRRRGRSAKARELVDAIGPARLGAVGRRRRRAPIRSRR